MAEVIKEWDAFEIVAPPLGQAIPVRGLKKGQPVSGGQLLARQPAGPRDDGPWGDWLLVPFYGDVHAPCSGIITEINEFEIIIQRDDQVLGEPPLPRALHDLSPEELSTALQELGFDVPQLRPEDPIIISTLNPEAGHSYSAALFSEHRETMLAGVTAASRLWPERRVIWAVADTGVAPVGAETFITSEKFPSAYPPTLKAYITVRTDHFGRGVFGGRELYFLGRLWRTGLPITRMVVTLGASNYFVPVGSRAADLLRFANMYPYGDDVVIEGGLECRGHSLARLERGLAKDVAALHLLRGLSLGPAAQPAPKPRQPGLRRLYKGPLKKSASFKKNSLLSRLFSLLLFPKLRLRLPGPKFPNYERPEPPGQPGFKARLKCGHQGQAPYLAEYHGPPDCWDAYFQDQGPRVCPYGCLGYGNCAARCPRGAISLREGFPHIDENLCTGCGACQSTCPKNLFELIPGGAKAFITCAAKSPLKKNAEYCPKACLGCGKCRKACPAGAISRPASFGAMLVNQSICQAHNESCGQVCRAVCPRKIL